MNCDCFSDPSRIQTFCSQLYGLYELHSSIISATPESSSWDQFHFEEPYSSSNIINNNNTQPLDCVRTSSQVCSLMLSIICAKSQIETFYYLFPKALKTWLLHKNKKHKQVLNILFYIVKCLDRIHLIYLVSKFARKDGKTAPGSS